MRKNITLIGYQKCRKPERPKTRKALYQKDHLPKKPNFLKCQSMVQINDMLLKMLGLYLFTLIIGH